MDSKGASLLEKLNSDQLANLATDLRDYVKPLPDLCQPLAATDAQLRTLTKRFLPFLVQTTKISLARLSSAATSASSKSDPQTSQCAPSSPVSGQLRERVYVWLDVARVSIHAFHILRNALTSSSGYQNERNRNALVHRLLTLKLPQDGAEEGWTFLQSMACILEGNTSFRVILGDPPSSHAQGKPRRTTVGDLNNCDNDVVLALRPPNQEDTSELKTLVVGASVNSISCIADVITAGAAAASLPAVNAESQESTRRATLWLKRLPDLLAKIIPWLRAQDGDERLRNGQILVRGLSQILTALLPHGKALGVTSSQVMQLVVVMVQSGVEFCDARRLIAFLNKVTSAAVEKGHESMARAMWEQALTILLQPASKIAKSGFSTVCPLMVARACAVASYASQAVDHGASWHAHQFLQHQLSHVKSGSALASILAAVCATLHLSTSYSINRESSSNTKPPQGGSDRVNGRTEESREEEAEKIAGAVQGAVAGVRVQLAGLGKDGNGGKRDSEEGSEKERAVALCHVLECVELVVTPFAQQQWQEEMARQAKAAAGGTSRRKGSQRLWASLQDLLLCVVPASAAFQKLAASDPDFQYLCQLRSAASGSLAAYRLALLSPHAEKSAATQQLRWLLVVPQNGVVEERDREWMQCVVYNMGVHFYNANRYTEAVEPLSIVFAAIKASPAKPKPEQQEKEKEKEWAREVLQQCARCNLLAQSLRRAGQLEEAQQVLEEGLRRWGTERVGKEGKEEGDGQLDGPAALAQQWGKVQASRMKAGKAHVPLHAIKGMTSDPAALEGLIMQELSAYEEYEPCAQQQQRCLAARISVLHHLTAHVFAHSPRWALHRAAAMLERTRCLRLLSPVGSAASAAADSAATGNSAGNGTVHENGPGTDGDSTRESRIWGGLNGAIDLMEVELQKRSSALCGNSKGKDALTLLASWLRLREKKEQKDSKGGAGNACMAAGEVGVREVQEVLRCCAAALSQRGMFTYEMLPGNQAAWKDLIRALKLWSMALQLSPPPWPASSLLSRASESQLLTSVMDLLSLQASSHHLMARQLALRLASSVCNASASASADTAQQQQSAEREDRAEHYYKLFGNARLSHMLCSLALPSDLPVATALHGTSGKGGNLGGTGKGSGKEDKGEELWGPGSGEWSILKAAVALQVGGGEGEQVEQRLSSMLKSLNDEEPKTVRIIAFQSGLHFLLAHHHMARGHAIKAFHHAAEAYRWRLAAFSHVFTPASRDALTAATDAAMPAHSAATSAAPAASAAGYAADREGAAAGAAAGAGSSGTFLTAATSDASLITYVTAQDGSFATTATTTTATAMTAAGGAEGESQKQQQQQGGKKHVPGLQHRPQEGEHLVATYEATRDTWPAVVGGGAKRQAGTQSSASPSPWRVVADYVDSLHQLGSVFEQLGMSEEAERRFTEGLLITRTLALPHAEGLFSSSLGHLNRKRRNWHKAQQHLSHAAALLHAAPTHPSHTHPLAKATCRGCAAIAESNLQQRLGDLARRRDDLEGCGAQGVKGGQENTEEEEVSSAVRPSRRGEGMGGKRGKNGGGGSGDGDGWEVAVEYYSRAERVVGQLVPWYGELRREFEGQVEGLMGEGWVASDEVAEGGDEERGGCFGSESVGGREAEEEDKGDVLPCKLFMRFEVEAQEEKGCDAMEKDGEGGIAGKGESVDGYDAAGEEDEEKTAGKGREGKKPKAPGRKALGELPEENGITADGAETAKKGDAKIGRRGSKAQKPADESASVEVGAAGEVGKLSQRKLPGKVKAKGKARGSESERGNGEDAEGRRMSTHSKAMGVGRRGSRASGTGGGRRNTASSEAGDSAAGLDREDEDVIQLIDSDDDGDKSGAEEDAGSKPTRGNAATQQVKPGAGHRQKMAAAEGSEVEETGAKAGGRRQGRRGNAQVKKRTSTTSVGDVGGSSLSTVTTAAPTGGRQRKVKAPIEVVSLLSDESSSDESDGDAKKGDENEVSSKKTPAIVRIGRTTTRRAAAVATPAAAAAVATSAAVARGVRRRAGVKAEKKQDKQTEEDEEEEDDMSGLFGSCQKRLPKRSVLASARRGRRRQVVEEEDSSDGVEEFFSPVEIARGADGRQGGVELSESGRGWGVGVNVGREWSWRADERRATGGGKCDGEWWGMGWAGWQLQEEAAGAGEEHELVKAGWMAAAVEALVASLLSQARCHMEACSWSVAGHLLRKALAVVARSSSTSLHAPPALHFTACCSLPSATSPPLTSCPCSEPLFEGVVSVGKTRLPQSELQRQEQGEHGEQGWVQDVQVCCQQQASSPLVRAALLLNVARLSLLLLHRQDGRQDEGVGRWEGLNVGTVTHWLLHAAALSSEAPLLFRKVSHLIATACATPLTATQRNHDPSHPLSLVHHISHLRALCSSTCHPAAPETPQMRHSAAAAAGSSACALPPCICDPALLGALFHAAAVGATSRMQHMAQLMSQQGRQGEGKAQGQEADGGFKPGPVVQEKMLEALRLPMCPHPLHLASSLRAFQRHISRLPPSFPVIHLSALEGAPHAHGGMLPAFQGQPKSKSVGNGRAKKEASCLLLTRVAAGSPPLLLLVPSTAADAPSGTADTAVATAAGGAAQTKVGGGSECEEAGEDSCVEEGQGSANGPSKKAGRGRGRGKAGSKGAAGAAGRGKEGGKRAGGKAAAVKGKLARGKKGTQVDEIASGSSSPYSSPVSAASSCESESSCVRDRPTRHDPTAHHRTAAATAAVAAAATAAAGRVIAGGREGVSLAAGTEGQQDGGREGEEERRTQKVQWIEGPMQQVRREFEAIMTESCASMAAGASAASKESKAAWWKWRLALDKRLQALVRGAETQLLGPWRFLLLGQPMEGGAAAADTAADGGSGDAGAGHCDSLAAVLSAAGRDLALVAGLSSSAGGCGEGRSVTAGCKSASESIRCSCNDPVCSLFATQQSLQHRRADFLIHLLFQTASAAGLTHTAPTTAAAAAAAAATSSAASAATSADPPPVSFSLDELTAAAHQALSAMLVVGIGGGLMCGRAAAAVKAQGEEMRQIVDRALQGAAAVVSAGGAQGRCAAGASGAGGATVRRACGGNGGRGSKKGGEKSNEGGEGKGMVQWQPVQLILDSAIQAMPWEGLPCLAQQRIYRLPSFASLLSLLAHHQHHQQQLLSLSPAALPAKHQQTHKGRSRGDRKQGGVVGGCGKEGRDADGQVQVCVDAKSTFYLLNPSGDLKSTQGTFEAWFKKQPTWKGKVCDPPSVEEFMKALEHYSLFVYCGHGSGEQYLHRSYLKKLSRCALSLLMGCSSAHLSPRGDYEPLGVPLSYLAAGCPAVVGNLWDVTDGDIDRYSQRVLESWVGKSGVVGSGGGMGKGGMRGCGVCEREVELCEEEREGGEKEGSVLVLPPCKCVCVGGTVAEARSVCRLRHLIGLAPVCYGVPCSLQQAKPV
ncbi:hypothetical protein CLOM_g9003 [Closterium sp. NIES-68]|nr:hypothetical protein CLOM_g9003 [Closterium sp. NIES-68]GJP59837.1 hypothetical protein CLOP_g15319 [Closterium sp. NIES-67]